MARATKLSPEHRANIGKGLRGNCNGLGNKGPIGKTWELNETNKANQSAGAKRRWERYRQEQSIVVGEIRIDLRSSLL
jgi:hypothetical protein